MPAPGALEPAAADCQRTARQVLWWQSAHSFDAHTAAHGRSNLRENAFFRIGDEVLQLAVDEPSLLDSFRAHYGECELDSVDHTATPIIRCTVGAGYPSSLIAVHILQGPPIDLATIALGMSHPPHGTPPYGISDADRAGWSLIGGRDRVVAAASRTGLLIDPQKVSEDFLSDYLVAAALSVQTNLMVLHAAALQIGAGGAILTGASHAGKTTTSMHLASRGHRLLGDEMAVIRLGSRELLPLRRSLSLRAGPRGPGLADALRRARACEGRGVSDKIGPLRIDQIFSASGDHPVALGAAFFLDGFAEHPVVEPFRLELNNESAFEHLSANEVASITWGMTPQRRALRLLALRQLMKRVRCWKLRVGTPDETADLIERTLEAG